MNNNGLIIYGDSKHVNRRELDYIPTPQETDSWSPIPHGRICDMIYNEAESRNYQIEEAEYGINPSGSKLFGVLKAHPRDNPEYSRAIGFRNSHDKSMALVVVAGIRVMICQNMAYSGELVSLYRRHTSGIKYELAGMLSYAFDRLEESFVKLDENIANLKTIRVTHNKAAVLAVRSAREGIIPSSRILPLLKEWEEPTYEEFKPRTMWSFVNAITHFIKQQSPQKSAQSHRALSRMFELG